MASGPRQQKIRSDVGFPSARHRIRDLPFRARPSADHRYSAQVHQGKEPGERSLDALRFMDLAAFAIQSAAGTIERLQESERSAERPRRPAAAVRGKGLAWLLRNDRRRGPPV